MEIRKHFGVLVSLLILGGIIVGGVILHGCGQAQQPASSSVGSTSKITGTVLVPSTTLSTSTGPASIRVSEATDGVSNTALADATVQGYDPVTNVAISGLLGTTGADGTFSIDKPAGVTLPDNILFKATKTVGDNVISTSALSSSTSTQALEMNAGSTTAWNAIKEKMTAKAGDLLEKASTLSAETKKELFSTLTTLLDKLPSIIGKLKVVPPMKFDKALTAAQIDKKQFEDMSSIVSGEIAEAPSDLVSSYNTHISSLQTQMSSLAETATYPSGLQLPVGYSGFTLPPNITLPSGTVFGYSPESSYIPAALYSKLPTGAVFGSGVPMPASGVTLPPSCNFISGFVLPSAYASGIPTGASFGSGFAGLPANAVMPPGANFMSGFDLTKATMGSAYAGDLSTAVGAIFSSGFAVPSNYAGTGKLPSGATFNSGVSFASGVYIPRGAVFGSGFVAPKEVALEAGFVVPKEMLFASGFAFTSGVNFTSGFAIPAGAIIGPGVTIGAGVKVDAGAILQSGAVIGSGANLESGFTVGPGVTIAAGATIPVGVAVGSGAVFQSGFAAPSGVVSGAELPSGIAPPPTEAPTPTPIASPSPTPSTAPSPTPTPIASPSPTPSPGM